MGTCCVGCVVRSRHAWSAGLEPARGQLAWSADTTPGWLASTGGLHCTTLTRPTLFSRAPARTVCAVQVIIFNKPQGVMQLHDRKGKHGAAVTCGDWLSDNRLGLASGTRVKISKPLVRPSRHTTPC